MGRGIGLSIVLIAIAVSLILPTVRADETTLGPDSRHDETHTLREGDIIKWNWKVVGSGEVDFWIEDSDGTKYGELDEAEMSEGQFIVPADGKWTVVIHNDEDHPPPVTVEYDIDFERVPFLPSWLAWVVLILVLLVIIGTVLTTRRPARPPQYPPQQPPKEES